jgi:hypothetical protein
MRLKPSSLAAAVAAAALLVPTVAFAATKNGITPVAPKAGGKIPSGKAPTFKMKVSGPGTVWVHVCKSKKKDSDGVICSDESIGRAKKKGGVFQYKPKFYDYAQFWLNTPGTYYWQAHRIDCAGDISDCRQEGPIVKFKVAGG